MTLKQYLFDMIHCQGPISVENFMHICLFHPNYGYYMNEERKDAFDFLTSPQISQAFGEMIGVWIMHTYARMNQSKFKNWKLIEMGGGAGAMMKDIMGVLSKQTTMVMPQVHMVEVSKVLRETQKKNLTEHKNTIQWHNSLEEIDLSSVPCIIVGNEFFDCFPIKQYVFDKNAWYERLIGIQYDESLNFVRGYPLSNKDLILIPEKIRNNACHQDIFEVCLAAKLWIQNLSSCLKGNKNFYCLFIDYGHEKSSFGDTVQGIRNKKPVSIFDKVGSCDITARVNFESIKKYSEECDMICDKIVTQRKFLTSLGIQKRMEYFLKHTEKEEHETIKRSISYLIHQKTMGELFKVMSIRGCTTLHPWGF